MLAVLYPAFGASLVLALVIEGVWAAVRGRKEPAETAVPS
jgi:hypothetical protein